MSGMTAIEALDLVENTLADLAISLSAHVQIKQLIAQIRQREAASREKSAEEPAKGKRAAKAKPA